MGVGYDVFDFYKIRESRNYIFVGIILSLLLFVVDVFSISFYVLFYKRYLNYLYLQDEWIFVCDWVFIIGICYDYYFDFGVMINFCLVLVWNVWYDFIVKVMYGMVF